MTGIYKIENLINGKKYIGQSINIYERWNDHKRTNERTSSKQKQTYPLYLAFKKYGIENFSFEIIEECSVDELDEKEKYWIKYYHSYIYDSQSNGYNLTLGGQGTNIISDENIDLFCKLWEQGKSVGEISKITKYNNHTIIDYLKNYCSSYTIEEGRRRGRQQNGISHRRAIIQYDLLGNKIQEYDSIKSAIQTLKFPKNSINNNLKRLTPTCKGYLFCYFNEDINERLKSWYGAYRSPKPIIQFDINNNVMKCFMSATVAITYFNRSDTSDIRQCCAGKIQSAYGYKWKFLQYEDIAKYNLTKIGIVMN